MCGIVGISSDNTNACLSIYNALTVLQHRGQDAAGMAVSDKDGFLSIHKNNGLVRDVFNEEQMININFILFLLILFQFLILFLLILFKILIIYNLILKL